MRRSRPATIMIANRYHTAFVRHQEQTFATEITAQGELREAMTALLEAFVAGDEKPDSVFRLRSDYDPDRGTMLEHKETGRKKRQRIYSHTPRALNRDDVVTMKVHDRDKWNNEIDQHGERVKPFVRVTLVDGSQVDFAWPRPSKAPAPSKTTKKKSSKKTSTRSEE